MLAVDGLTKTFGGLRAVSGVTFSVEQGSVVGLIGPNGAGKTTTFEMISGFQHPTSGTVTFKGQRITGLSPDRVCRLGLTRTFQIVQPFPRLTVLQNVMVGAYARHRTVAEGTRRAEEILERMQMADRRDELACNLTLADLKRVELARAVATRPEVILLDEVVAGLTPTEVEEMMSVLRSIRADGITLVMIEHVMQAVMALSDVIVVLHHGEKIFEGTPQATAKSPQVIEAYLGEELLLA